MFIDTTTDLKETILPIFLGRLLDISGETLVYFGILAQFVLPMFDIFSSNIIGDTIICSGRLPHMYLYSQCFEGDYSTIISGKSTEYFRGYY